MPGNVKNELTNKLLFNHKIDLSQAIFVVAAGYSLTHDIELLKEVYDIHKPLITCVDTIYPHLLKYGIEPDIIANLDHHPEKFEMMSTGPEGVDIRNTRLLSYAKINEPLYNLYPKERIIEGAFYPVTESVLSLALSYSIIEWPTKPKIVLGADLCWIDEDHYYFQGVNAEQGKRNIRVASCSLDLDSGEDIYGTHVYTNFSSWIVNKWIENLCKLVPETVINGSRGPSMFGINSIDIIKKPLKDIMEEL